MPKKYPQQHQLGASGELAIMSALTDSHWICNKLPYDYGDDLVIIPTNAHNVGNYFVTCQVKTTEILKSVTVSCADITRWSIGDAIAALFVFEKSTKKIYYTFLSQNSEAWGVALDHVITGKKNIRVSKSRLHFLSDISDFKRGCDLLFCIGKLDSSMALREQALERIKKEDSDEGEHESIFRAYSAQMLLISQTLLQSFDYMHGDEINRKGLILDIKKFFIDSNYSTTFLNPGSELNPLLVLLGTFSAYRFFNGVYVPKILNAVFALAEGLRWLLSTEPEGTTEFWQDFAEKNMNDGNDA